MAATTGVECRLDSTQTLSTLLGSLQLKEKDQRVHCEASSRGLKFQAYSPAKDVILTGWMFSEAFQEYTYTSTEEKLNIKLPLPPLISCLQIFSSNAALTLCYQPEVADELRLALEDEGAVTECHVRALHRTEDPPSVPFLGTGAKLTLFRIRPEAWHAALSEFQELDATSGTELRLLLRRAGDPLAEQAAVSLRAGGIAGEAEVELPWRPGSGGPLEEFEVEEEAAHRYRLQSILSGCLKATANATAVKVRLNAQGLMSMQCILRARSVAHIFCEVVVVPMADGEIASAPAFPASEIGAQRPSATPARSGTQGGDSLFF